MVGIAMSKMDTWWWLSAPYSLIFPVFVLAFRLRESVGHAATLFLFVAFLAAVSSILWMLVTIYRVSLPSKIGLTLRTKVKLVFVLVIVILWIFLLAAPD
jgi:hypothetical protein